MSINDSICYAPIIKLSAKEVLQLRRLPYDEYLKSDYWKQIQQFARKYYDHTCMMCSCSDILNVHHRTYARRGCERISDLILLCRFCHEKFHDKIFLHKNNEFEHWPNSDMPSLDQYCLKCGCPIYAQVGKNNFILNSVVCDVSDNDFEEIFVS